jgi:hypothetical protein
MAYDIPLSECYDYNISVKGILTSMFLGYKITSDPGTDNHKIEKL